MGPSKQAPAAIAPPHKVEPGTPSSALTVLLKYSTVQYSSYCVRIVNKLTYSRTALYSNRKYSTVLVNY